MTCSDLPLRQCPYMVFYTADDRVIIFVDVEDAQTIIHGLNYTTFARGRHIGQPTSGFVD